MMSLLPFWGLKVVVKCIWRDRKLSDFVNKIFIGFPKMNTCYRFGTN